MTRSGKKEHPLGNTSYSQLSELSSNNYFTDIVYHAVELSCFPSLYHHSHLRLEVQSQTEKLRTSTQNGKIIWVSIAILHKKLIISLFLLGSTSKNKTELQTSNIYLCGL